MKDLSGKVAVVTGAASGIGLACARAFAGAGMAVALLDVRAEALVEAQAELQRLGPVHAICCDVADAQAMSDAADEVIRIFGKVHLLMNNAAVFIRGLEVANVEDDVWDWLLGVNLYGPIHGVRAFLPHMKRHGEGGHIVNTSSISGFLVAPRRNGVYSTAKFALVGYSEVLRIELEQDGIGVSVIMPAAVSSDFYLTSAALRGELGGANEFATTPADTAAGMSPDEVASRTLDGIREGRFYIATHAELRPRLEERHREMMAAFDAAERWRARPSDP